MDKSVKSEKSVFYYHHAPHCQIEHRSVTKKRGTTPLVIYKCYPVISLTVCKKTKDSISMYSPTSALLILKSVKSGEEVAGGGKTSIGGNILKNEPCNVQQSQNWQTLQGLIVFLMAFRNHKGSCYYKIYATKNQ